MAHVSDYYDFLEMKQTVDKRRIYLASDDPKVFQEAVNKYPNYEIIGDPLISKTAAVKNRYTQASLFGIIFDIHMLSMSDYLVCTFSSQVNIFFNVQIYIIILHLNSKNNDFLLCFLNDINSQCNRINMIIDNILHY